MKMDARFSRNTAVVVLLALMVASSLVAMAPPQSHAASRYDWTQIRA